MSTSNFNRFALVALLGLPAAVQAQVVSDLRGDWSDAMNPNGRWAYRQTSTLLPSGTWSSDFAAQPAWVGAFPIMWLRAQSTAGFDVQVGDIVTHSSKDTANLGNVIWTSPNNGTIDINGGVWMIRDIGRANDWVLRKNGALLSTGSLFSGDPYNRANPFNLDAGSGGALNAVAVSVGDQIELSFLRISANGDYNGVNFSVTLTTVPEPSSIILSSIALCGAFGPLCRRIRKRAVMPFEWRNCAGVVDDAALDRG